MRHIMQKENNLFPASVSFLLTFIAAFCIFHASVPAAGPAELVSGYTGTWVDEKEEYSELVLDSFQGSTFHFDIAFYRIAHMEGTAFLTEDGSTAGFTDDIDSSITGYFELTDDTVRVVVSDPEDHFAGYFRDTEFVFRREGYQPSFGQEPSGQPEVAGGDSGWGNSMPDADVPFYITPEELASEIEWIRMHYYTPSDGDFSVTLYPGDYGWDYSRQYYYYNGDLIFAFVFQGQEEHRLYFKDDHMIRYIDEFGNVYDWGDLSAFSWWESTVLEEAYAVNPKTTSADAGWLGTWTADNGEYLQIYDVHSDSIDLLFHKYSDGPEGMIDSYYTLYFMPDNGTVAMEAEEVEQLSGWRYVFHLVGDRILVTSRYPDEWFVRSSY